MEVALRDTTFKPGSLEDLKRDIGDVGVRSFELFIDRDMSTLWKEPLEEKHTSATEQTEQRKPYESRLRLPVTADTECRKGIQGMLMGYIWNCFGVAFLHYSIKLFQKKII